MAARTESAAPSLDRLKRRQAVQVFFFLCVVALSTAGLFHFVRQDAVSYRRGVAALGRNDFQVAAAQLENAWKLGYRRPELQIDLARSLWASDRRDEAMFHYTEALASRQPLDFRLLDTVVGLDQAQGQAEEALALFALLGAVEDLPLEALARLGDLQEQTGRFEEAIVTYRLAVQRSPNEAELRLRLGVVLSWVGRPKEAIEVLRGAVALDPTRRIAQRYLGRVLMWDGRFAEAVEVLRRSLAE